MEKVEKDAGKKKKRRSKGEGSIYFDDNKKRWVSQITIGKDPMTGKSKKKTFYGKTKIEVIKKKSEFERTSYGLKIDSDTIVFDEFFNKWLYGIKKGEIKEKSFYKYESLYNNHIKKAPFLYTKLKEITYTDLKMFYSDLQAENSVSQIIYINDLIKSCFEVAVIDNIMKNNPAKRIKFKEQENNRIKVLSAEEQKIMIDYLYESKYEDEVIRNMILFNFGAGLRLGETLALTWNDISFKTKILRVNKQLQKIKVNGEWIDKIVITKTSKSNREIPLPDKTIKLLKTIKNDKKINKKNLVFYNPDNGDYITNKRPAKNLHAICQKLHLSDIDYHGTRHCYATRLFEAGVQIKTVQKLLGHADIKTTMNIYTHVMSDIKEDAVKKLNDFL